MTALCLAAALVCATLRAAHPQIALAVALAVGAGVLMLSLDDLAGFAAALRTLSSATEQGAADGDWLVKLCGLALGTASAQYLSQAGWQALRGRGARCVACRKTLTPLYEDVPPLACRFSGRCVRTRATTVCE